ncbi:SMC-Scp complex subunit ScpB [Marinisporobacter balticus]|uniref:Segregation and condensation protein B n=1 Tax=Marinisporobacter balticus TaxID=2018667 RepID=A0A4R2LKB8_9FIRM|nr:SMC-Scp complex subunit ScpB [Marinisporobacter balticus]TCO79825.1 segregation and condensation protein B [Marinisporobacter balticus]
MEEKEVKSIIEAMLFVWGDPLNIKSIADILNLPSAFIRKSLMDLKKEYEIEDRGIQIIEVNNSFQLCTNNKHFEYIQNLCKPVQNKGLTQAALEVLVIIAYNQPITRPGIESIRGVKSDKAINTLIEKELIIEKGRLERTGRPILYGTTDTFLKSFGLNSLEELPKIEDFETLDFTDE